MRIKTIALQLNCSTPEVYRLIETLDRLRETIAIEYEEEIRGLFADEDYIDSDQYELPFDNPIDF